MTSDLPEKPLPPIESPLLKKVRALGLTEPYDLERLAIDRGCHYYERDLPPRTAPLGEVPLSDTELAIALLAPTPQRTAREIRIGACLLSGDDGQPEEIAKLACQENCAGIVRYIANCGIKYEPENTFWTILRDQLPDVQETSFNVHPTRFIEMTGMIRGKVGFFTRWVRPKHCRAL